MLKFEKKIRRQKVKSGVRPKFAVIRWHTQAWHTSPDMQFVLHTQIEHISNVFPVILRTLDSLTVSFTIELWCRQTICNRHTAPRLSSVFISSDSGSYVIFHQRLCRLLPSGMLTFHALRYYLQELYLNRCNPASGYLLQASTAVLHRRIMCVFLGEMSARLWQKLLIEEE